MKFRSLMLAGAIASLAGLSIYPSPTLAASTPHVGNPWPTISGPVTRVSSPVAFSGPDVAWINNHNVPLVLKDAQYYVTYGGYHLHAAPGQYVASIELATNPQSHAQLIEVGTPTPASIAAVPHGGQSASSSGGSASGHNPAEPDPSTSGYYEVVWHDPVDASLAIVKDNMSWTYDGTYVDSYSYSDYRWWYSNDGWFAYGHSMGSYFTDGNQEAVAWTYQHFQNNVFCAGSSTYIRVDDNNVEGWGDGSVGGYVNTWDWGGCASWLGYYTLVGGGA